MGDQEYRDARRSGSRASQVYDQAYQPDPRWTSSPQHLQTAKQYVEQQSGQYPTYQRDPGYQDTRLYRTTQGGPVTQDMAGNQNYWSGSPSTDSYQDPLATIYAPNQPEESRGESSRQRQSRPSGRSRGTRQAAILRPVSEDEKEFNILIRSRNDEWQESRGFHDTGNRTSHLISSRKVLSLGYDRSHVDFDDVQEFRTVGGPHYTLGSIKLVYSLPDGEGKRSRFQVFDSKNIPELDVIFSPSQRDELSIDSPSPIVLMTLLDKKKVNRDVIRAQRDTFIQREREAAEEDEEEQRNMGRQVACRTRPPNRQPGPSYGASSSRDARPQREDQEYQDWFRQQYYQTVQPEAEPTRHSSPYSGQPGYYADVSSTHSRTQEADTRETSVYYNEQDGHYYQQDPAYGPEDAPEPTWDERTQSFDYPPSGSSRQRKTKKSGDPKYRLQTPSYREYPAQDPRGQQNPPNGYDAPYYGSQAGR